MNRIRKKSYQLYRSYGSETQGGPSHNQSAKTMMISGLRLHSGCRLAGLLSVGIQAAFRLHSGCIQAAFKLHSGCIQAAFCLHPGCMQAALRLLSGCFQAAFRLHAGSTQAGCRSSFR